MTLDSYFKNEDAFATILYPLCVKTFGDEFKTWEMETVAIHLQDIPSINVDKIMSIKALYESIESSFNFFNEVNCFSNTIKSLNGLEPLHDFLVKHHSHQIFNQVE